MADQSLFRRQIQPARAGARSDDERPGVDRFFANVQRQWMLGEVDGTEMGHAQLGAEANRLLFHVFDELGTLDALGPAGKILHQRGDGKLSAGLVAFEDQRLEIGACSVNGSGKSGAPGAENDSVARRVFRNMDPNSVNARRRKRMQGRLW